MQMQTREWVKEQGLVLKPIYHGSENSPFPGARFTPDVCSVLERRKGGIIRLGEVSSLLPVGLQNERDKTTTLTIL